MAKHQANRRALDLGFGFTKFSQSEYLDDDTLSVSAFPSYAAQALDSHRLGSGVLADLNVIKVAVGDEEFLVGEDVRRAADGGGRQLLEATFFRSSQYLALAKGAFAFMCLPAGADIDRLVIGLPLNVYDDDSLVEHVQKSIEGVHVVPNLSETGGTRTIQVKQVHIIPQVVGSLVAMSRDVGLMEKINNQQNLTIDVGYGTLVWLVTHGFSPVPARSGANMGGVSTLLQKVARAIDPSAATNINILDRLDQAFLNHSPSIKVHGADVLVAKHQGVLSSAATENLTEMLRDLGDTIDIDNVFLTGGGAHLYAKEIAAAFPKRKLHFAAKGSRFTNVRGFQFLAENES